MINSHHWDASFCGPKSKELLDFTCSAYWFDNKFRVCAKCRKQTYYFELFLDDLSTTNDIEEATNEHMNKDRENSLVDKCIRCSKWNVSHSVSNHFCDRCFHAVESGGGNTELDIVL